MEFLPGTEIACVTYKQLVPDFMCKDAYDSNKKRKKIKVHGRGGNGSKVLIELNSLPPDIKNKLVEKYGAPEKVKEVRPLYDRMVTDVQANNFYIKYTLEDGGKLPPDYINKYTEAASFLNLLVQLTDQPKTIKQGLGKSMAEFWKDVALLIKDKKIDLPANRIRLQEKIAKYKAEGYAHLIETWRFNNSYRAKIKDEVAESVLLDMIENGKQHDDTVIMYKYNIWARTNGRDEIKSATTIGKYRARNGWNTTGAREGRAAGYNKYGIVINRKRPSAPLLLVNSDDNELDLFFRHTYLKGDKEITTPFKRYVVMVVIDAFNDYILGYAIGDAQTTKLVKQAYLNAMYHIKQLTGQWYLPFQVQTDRWGVNKDLNNELSMFYKGIGTYTPAKQYNARSKYIERSFGVEWHQQLKLYPNYAGFNITAAERLNPDVVAMNKAEYPTSDLAPKQIAHFIEQMRSRNNRQQEWIAAFNASNKSKERLVDDEYILTLFGIAHERQNTINNEGITIEIDRVRYKYLVPEELYLQNVGKKVQVYYEPHDMSRILVTDGNTLRFVAYNKPMMPSALADYQPGDRKLLNDLLEMGQRNVQKIADTRNKRKNVLKKAGIDTEKMLSEGGIYTNSVLQSGTLDKGIKQEATQKYLEQQYGESSDSKEFDPYDLI